MPVFRVEKNRNYTVMSNFHLKDKNLSLKSKGLLSLILSLPDEWNYTTRGLAAISKEGVDSIGAALKELEVERYLIRNRLRDERGRITDTEYVVYEYPRPLDTALPDTASPYTENPDMAIPNTENSTQINNYKELRTTKGLNTLTNNKKQTNPIASAPGTDSPDVGQLSPDSVVLPPAKSAQVPPDFFTVPADHAMTLVEHEQQFEQFWQLYPRKAGKKAAKKAWMDVKPDEALFAIIMSAINTAKQYWKHQGISVNHIPHPSTWLDEERWDDEFLPEQLSSKASSQNIAYNGQNQGGEQTATIGANYTIGGEDDPYRAIIPD